MRSYRDSRIVKISLIVFFILILIYAYFESRTMLYGPRITVPSDTILVDEPFAVIRGQATNITELRINSTIVPVTEDGVFQESYMVTPGQNHIVLDASDKFGRTRERTIDVVYIPQETKADTSQDKTTATSTEEVAPR